MALVSRRDLISGGVAAGAVVLLPNQMFPSSDTLGSSALHSVSMNSDGKTDQVENAPYSPAMQAKILDLAHDTLTKLFEGKMLSEIQPSVDLLRLAPAHRVNITLRHAGRMRGSESVPGTNLGSQIIESVYAASMDRSNGGHLTKWEVPDVALEVWLQTGSVEVSHSARFEKGILLLGIEGLEIEGRDQLAYFLPSVPITSKYKTEVALLEALCRKAGFEKDAWLRPDVSLRKTQWVCITSVSNSHFFGEKPDTDAKLPIPLDSSIEESASYLIRNQDANGRTAYLYDPFADAYVGKATNIVRSAGCLLALSLVLESNHRIAHDSAFKACTVKMAKGLLNLTSVTANGLRVLREEETGKTPEDEKAGEQPGDEEMDWETPQEKKKAGELPSLGATALLAAALSGNTLRKEFAQEYSQLYHSIVSAQKPDGRFVTHFGEDQENEGASNFYPGEALLVLAMEAERKNSEALEMCRRAYQPYVAQFRSKPTSAFTVWHINVWSRIAQLTGERAFADFVFEQAEFLLRMQVKTHADPRWVGGFSQSGAAPRVYTVAFTEAIALALALAVRTRDSERTTRYADCVRSGLRFCRLLQLETSQATLLANPVRCKGGIAFSLIDRRVRCDAVQHFITLCLAAEQIKEDLL
ncbi:MAG: AMMECR1 domain-containing protein [Terracidiphilus sp.]